MHAHRDSFSHFLGQSGTQTARAKARARSDEIPHLADLHFPVGGHRFRPCLEDVLEMLVTEFGVDHPEAADLLTTLGYVVTWPGGPPPPGNPERLGQL